MSGAMIFIQEDLKVSDTEIEILAGILNFCALIGSLVAGRTSDYLGRRYTIFVACIAFLLGSVLMGYGPNYPILITGRCIAGIGVGFALMIAPVYSAEISSASHRGFLTSLPELCISIGILLGYIANYFFAKLALELGWRLMLGVAAIPSLFLAIGILQMPESPRWLVLQGRLDEARKVLGLVSNSASEAELRFLDIKVAVGIDESCEEERIGKSKMTTRGGESELWKEVLFKPSPTVRLILLAAVGVHFFEHAVGIEAVILYSPRIFKQAGIVTKSKLLIATIGIGVTKTAFITLATLFIDKVGRRPLLLLSTAGAAMALAGLGLGLTVVEHAGDDEKVVWALDLSIAATYAYVALFSIGIAPITWVYSSEIWPLRLRGLGSGISVAVNRLMNAAVSMSFLSICKAITTGGAFFMFSGIAILAWFFFFFLLPETKGKSLEEIEMVFSKKAGGDEESRERMGETADSSSFMRKHWEGWTGFWSDRFSFLDNYTRFGLREKPLPSWTPADVEAFIASEPVHGPALRTARDSVLICLAGTAVGAVSTAGFCWKYSKSPHGSVLALGAGAMFGWTFGQEIANHWYQLYRLDTMTAQTKFLEWWEENSAGRS